MPLDEKIIEYIRENGPSSGLTSEAEIMCAEEIIKHMPGVEMVRFLASGSEADSLAIRLARTYTGKKKIIKIAGSYHGWSDQLLVSTDYPGIGRLHASGIPSECLDNTIEVAPNDFEGLRKAFIENQKDGIAGILAEPTGGHAGTFPVHPDWNKTLRAICDEFGALLIFDEVVTGFRLSLGGGQEYYGITPDLTVLGKIVSHGYPSAGALGGKKEIMRFCHPGGEGHRKAYTGGSLSANPISTLAGYYAIKFIEEYQACEKAATYGNKVTGCLNQLFATRKDLSFFAYNIQSIVHVETGCPSGVYLKNMDFDHQVAEQNTRSSVGMDVYLALMTKGVMILGDCKRLYCCMQHNDQTLDQFMKAWEYVLSLFPVR
jgi:glutamate-1-semialdehyde 2,1-aminomutase